MTYNAEQITYMLAEAIDKDREYKSWHVSTKHLMTLVEMVVAEEREACAKVCETFDQREAFNDEDMAVADACATAIRARSNP
jgi:hypothetical protein